MATCNDFVFANPDLPVPNNVTLGAITVAPSAPHQCAHCDQFETNPNGQEEAADRWQGIITGHNASNLLVYIRVDSGTLVEVNVKVPPFHLLAFGGRLMHAGAANTGDTPLTSLFTIYIYI